jgi:hypothetical protein
VLPFDDLPDQTSTNQIINSNLLSLIRSASQSMVLPTWFTRLPRSFGSASAGSLKADQWRVVATLYAPLVLIKEWHGSENSDVKVWLQVTTELMSAVYACSSHSVSDESIELYRNSILAYLKLLKEHFTVHKWVPNYHAALHVIELLKLYGPTYGWWTFPFERLIRELQNIRTNSRIGKDLDIPTCFKSD